MKLSIENGELALPDGFAFEIESRHPFFSDEGTASVPVTLPPSPDNLTRLGNPDNFRNSRRYVRTHQAMLQTGTFSKKCVLVTDSAGPESGISASLAFFESDMYASLKDRNVRDIMAGLEYVPSRLSAITAWQLYQNERESAGGDALDDVAIFPVASDRDDSGSVSIINEPLPAEYRFRDEARTVTVNGKSFAVPKVYGVAPYLYLWALIKHVFTLSGFTVVKNDFADHTYLQTIVLLHNCADPCTDYGTFSFSYADLCPSITVGELISFLRDTFGAVVLQDSGMVSIVLMKDSMAYLTPHTDLSRFASPDYDVVYPEPREMERSFDTSIESAEPAADSLVDLRAMTKTMNEVDTVDQISGSGYFHVGALGKYYYKAAAQEKVMIGSDCIPYRRKMGMEVESVSSAACYVPMVLVGTKYMPYVGNRIHRHIDVEGADPEAAQPIMMCYAHFMTAAEHYCGSSYSYDETGQKKWTSLGRTLYKPLTPEGLADYWSEYEPLLLNAAPEIETKLYMPVNTLMSLERSRPMLFRGAKVFIKSMSYALGDDDLVEIDAVLQLMPSYSDAVTVPEISFENKSIGWVLKTDKNVPENDGISRTDSLQDYTAADAPEGIPAKTGIITKRRSRWLEYLYTVWQGESVISEKALYQWEEYFISDYVEN